MYLVEYTKKVNVTVQVARKPLWHNHSGFCTFCCCPSALYSEQTSAIFVIQSVIQEHTEYSA